MERKGRTERRTGETRIMAEVFLDGSGTGKIFLTLASQKDGGADLAFFRHMLETFAKYSGWDINIEAKGDLPHHLKEDVAITLARSLREALNLRPVSRMGYSITAMDDALVRAVVDVVERPYFAGSLPDKMYTHFFRTFASEARITLHLDVLKGENRHHMVEAAFKAVGGALRDAVRPISETLSTKGVVDIRNLSSGE